MNKLKTLLAQRESPLLSVFFTAGYPGLHDTVPIAMALEAAGVDLIEIGIPYSDPVADGVVIQESSKRALENGMTVTLLLEQLRALRQRSQIPVILMGYFNQVLQYGVEQFCKDAALAGVDGLLLPDLPPEVYKREYVDMMGKYNFCPVFMVAPTTTDIRIREIDELAEGFIYAVSASSVTGKTTGFLQEQFVYFERLRTMKLRNPFLIGFGIASPEAFHTACGYAAGAIVGSDFIRLLKTAGADPAAILSYIQKLRTVPQPLNPS